MLVDAVVSWPHYRDHLASTWDLLPDDVRGTMWASRHGLDLPTLPARWPKDRLVLCAGWVDVHRSRPRSCVLVEHGAGQSYCLAPETRVLTSALRWVPVASLSVGDDLVAFEEERSTRVWRQWRTATVTGTRELVRPCYRLHMADGTKIVASAEHRWLRREKETYGWLPTSSLQDAVRYPKHPSKLLKAFDTWNEDRSWGAGYLAAAFDGEGSLCQTTRHERQNRVMLSFTQKENAMLALVKHELLARGFDVGESAPRPDGVRNLSIRGGAREVFRFLGSVRPRRLLENMSQLVNGQMRGKPVGIDAMEFLGDQPVVGVTTTTGTLIAEGFASHNSADARSARHPSYSGGNRHENVALFICPSETVAARWRERYPDTPTAVVGSPKMDAYYVAAATRSTTAVGDLALGGGNPAGVKMHRRAGPVVAVTFHYELSLVPETMSALPHYERGLEAFLSAARAHGWEVLGHGHPRLWKRIERVWRHLGVEPVRDLAAVYDRADVLCVDNSSAGPEFASLGKPLVWMNAPWYRRQVEHGCRFWHWTEGQVMVDEPGELAAAVAHALDDPSEVRASREAMVRDVYAFTDGHAAERAAAAVVELARGI